MNDLDLLQLLGVTVIEVEGMSHDGVYVRDVDVALIRADLSDVASEEVAERLLCSATRVPPPPVRR